MQFHPYVYFYETNESSGTNMHSRNLAVSTPASLNFIRNGYMRTLGRYEGEEKRTTSTVHRGFSQSCLKATFHKMSFLGKQIYMAFLENAHKQTNKQKKFGTSRDQNLAFETRYQDCVYFLKNSNEFLLVRK